MVLQEVDQFIIIDIKEQRREPRTAGEKLTEGSSDTNEPYGTPTDVSNKMPKNHVITERGDFSALPGEDTADTHSTSKQPINSKIMFETHIRMQPSNHKYTV